MAETNSFEFNFGRASGEAKNITVDVSEDRPSAEQPCFVYSCSKTIVGVGQWIGAGGDREWPDLHSPFSFQIDPVMERPEEACKADARAGSVAWTVVSSDQGRGRPDCDSGFYDLAVRGVACREFWRYDHRDSTGGTDGTATTDLFERQSARLRSLGFVPIAREPRDIASLQIQLMRIRYGLCLRNRPRRSGPVDRRDGISTSDKQTRHEQHETPCGMKPKPAAYHAVTIGIDTPFAKACGRLHGYRAPNLAA